MGCLETMTDRTQTDRTETDHAKIDHADSDHSKAGERESLLEFPCSFPIKAMGRHNDAFQNAVTDIVFRHAQMWPGEDVQLTPGRKFRFSDHCDRSPVAIAA